MVRKAGEILFNGSRAGISPRRTPRKRDAGRKHPGNGAVPDSKRTQMQMRNAGLHLDTPAGFLVDHWAWHRRASGRPSSREHEGARVVIFPSGSQLWDRTIADAYAASGATPRFLRVWEVFGGGASRDAIEALTCAQPERISRYVRELLADVLSDGDAHLVLPYDMTPLSRSLAIAAQERGIPTICALLPSLADSARFRGATAATAPVCDHVAIPVLPGHATGAAWSTRGHACVVDALAAPADGGRDGSAARRMLGVSPEDDVVVVLATTSEMGRSAEHASRQLAYAVERAAARVDPRTHLVLVLDGQSGEPLAREITQALAQIYKKSVLVQGDPTDLLDLIRHAAWAIVCDESDAFVLRHAGLPHELVRLGDADDLARGDAPQPASPASMEALSLTAFAQRTIQPRASSAGDVPPELSEKLARIDAIRSPSRKAFDVIAVPDPLTNEVITSGRQRHLCALLNSNTRVYGADDVLEAAMAEVFVQWGAEPNEPKSRPEVMRSAFARPKLFVEDGFVRSMGLWTDPNEPTLSTIIDTDAVYYDATRSSLMEKILNSGWTPSASERERARALIARIRDERISKYNYAPALELDLGPRNRRRILLVDQKAGDMSLKYGMADASSFTRMVDAARALGPEVEIVIKQHPCAITAGAHEAHYTQKSLGAFAAQSNVHLIAFDINPYSLLEAVDEVWVVSSGMGFEALLADKPVRCFGVPFYGNWGLTQDEIELPRRHRSRTLEEVFHVAYVWLTRYYDPRRESPCELEALLDYIGEQRALVGRL